MRRSVCVVLLTLAAACNSNPNHLEKMDVYKERAFLVGVKTCVDIMSQDMATSFAADAAFVAATVPDQCRSEKRAAYSVEVDEAAKSFLITAKIKAAGGETQERTVSRSGKVEGERLALSEIQIDPPL